MATLVVAIDFGTTFSGYGYSYKWDKEKIYTHTWKSSSGVHSLKTPTALLLDGEHKFVAFGYEAQQQYTELKKSGFGSKSYYFDCFKMQLYDKNLREDLRITAVDGRNVPANKVFRESLKYLKNHFLGDMKEIGKKVDLGDIHWVLTVPAIWTEPAKQFMKNAAVEAGLVTSETINQLTIALEPEAASVWCKRQPCGSYAGRDKSGEPLQTEIGAKYLVVDCGGGTIDTTLHQIVADNNIKEISKASGGGWGGTVVDKNIMTLFTKAIGNDVLETYKQDHPQEYVKMTTEIRFAKHSVKPTDSSLSIELKYNLMETISKMRGKPARQVFNEKEGVKFVSGHLQFSADVVRPCFVPAVTKISKLVRDVLNNTPDIKYILLVGGFANSPFVRNAVEEAAEHNSATVFTPEEPEIVVVKGAVLFGHNPNVITERISALTYGLAVRTKFDGRIHPKHKMIIVKGEKKCKGTFSKLVEEGESFETGKKKTFHYTAMGKSARFQFFCTKEKNAIFVDEPHVSKMYSYTVDNIELDSGDEASIELTLCFDTNINITTRIGNPAQVNNWSLDLTVK